MELPTLLQLCVHYSLTVFAAGFVLGFIRVVVLIQKLELPEDRAILCEIPLMLAISWLVAKKTIADAKKKPVIVCKGDSCEKKYMQLTLKDGVHMGLISFFYLQLYEFLLGKYFSSTGLSLVQFITSQFHYPAYIGLCGQLVFAVIPVIQLRHSNNKPLRNDKKLD